MTEAVVASQPNPPTPAAEPGPLAKLRALVEMARTIAAPDEAQLAELSASLRRWTRQPLGKQFDLIARALNGLPEAWRSGAEVQYLQAQLDLWAGRKARARKRAEALHQAHPRDLRFALLSAHTALNTGEAQAADLAYRRALVLAPGREDIFSEQAALKLIRERQEQVRIAPPPQHRLVVVTALKNEGDDILEWLCFHHAIGVEHFYLYLNECTDHTLREIQRFAHPEALTLHEVCGDLGQRRANLHFIDTYRHQARWCAFIDADEFLLPTLDDNVPDAVERLARSGASAIAVNWLNFGSSGHQTRPQGLCMESFTRRAPDNLELHRAIKMICRPDHLVRYLQPHHSIMFGHWVLADGTAVYPAEGRVARRTDLGLVLNHYCTKSREQMLAKHARGRPLAADDERRIRDLSFFSTRDRNEVEDLRIKRFASRTKALLNRCGARS